MYFSALGVHKLAGHAWEATTFPWLPEEKNPKPHKAI